MKIVCMVWHHLVMQGYFKKFLDFFPVDRLLNYAHDTFFFAKHDRRNLKIQLTYFLLDYSRGNGEAANPTTYL